ncbi:hypothetical protein [Algibacter sp. 2305UL17-15]|uniref:hypothetical protein n=1 Tax=Algibacter sp. 2305UL17-15 TaxID=3231268 RepID=UPI003459F9F5
MDAKSHFERIRADFCAKEKAISEGKMMRSEAIHYKGKVFAFLSTKAKMVFKLGKEFDTETIDVPLEVFSPFKNKKPMSGWYQLDFHHKETWRILTEKALQLIKH